MPVLRLVHETSRRRSRLAHSGRAGLAATTSAPLPDVVVLDLVLSDLSGTDICRRLREHERTREIDRVVGFEIGAEGRDRALT
jgi:two-component system phosphate regulon response regulator PhoB